MDPLSIAIRALATFGFLLILVRLSGKRTVREGTSFDFVLALVLGDLVDDAVWSEVPMAQFVAAAGALVFMKLALTAHKLFTRPS